MKKQIVKEINENLLNNWEITLKIPLGDNCEPMMKFAIQAYLNGYLQGLVDSFTQERDFIEVMKETDANLLYDYLKGE